MEWSVSQSVTIRVCMLAFFGFLRAVLELFVAVLLDNLRVAELQLSIIDHCLV